VTKVAFQGELGAYSEEAVTALFWGENVELMPCRGFIDVVTAVVDGHADRGVLPVENSIIGRVIAGADAASTVGLRVLKKIALPIHHCLLAPPGANLEGLQRVLSHPAAIAQCSRFLRAHPRIEVIEWYDTAGAARDVALSSDPSTSAIASRRAAERYKLEVLVEGVEDDARNETSFVLVEKH
jgi:prephenate dehydratase